MTRHVASGSVADVDDLGEHYARSRGRVQELLDGTDPSRSTAAVAACPGWTVDDVVAHLVGVIEDAASDRIHGVPGPAQTQAQVERHVGTDLDALLERWSALAPRSS